MKQTTLAGALEGSGSTIKRVHRSASQNEHVGSLGRDGSARDGGGPPAASASPADELVGVLLAEVVAAQALLEVIHSDLAILVLVQHLEKLSICNPGVALLAKEIQPCVHMYKQNEFAMST